MSYLMLSAAGMVLAFWLAIPILIGLFVVALLADRLLERLRQYSRTSYAALGAVIGVAVGALLVGWLFKQPVRGAVCGVPVGALAGLTYWQIARPH